MDSMLFIIAIFVSIFIAFGMVVTATTIRQLREEVAKLDKENWKLEQDYCNLKEHLRNEVAKLKEENHNLSCSEKSLLWQRKNLRNEICRLISDAKYYYEKKDVMHDNFKKVGVYKNGRQTMPFSEAWNIAVKMIYNWS